MNRLERGGVVWSIVVFVIAICTLASCGGGSSPKVTQVSVRCSPSEISADKDSLADIP